MAKRSDLVAGDLAYYDNLIVKIVNTDDGLVMRFKESEFIKTWPRATPHRSDWWIRSDCQKLSDVELLLLLSDPNFIDDFPIWGHYYYEIEDSTHENI
tara:strand:- start:211 stop:504 length:294 start_codon:yes stop_codon:yes gene_type:complete